MSRTYLCFSLLLIASFMAGCTHFHLHAHPHGVANDLDERLGRYQATTVIPDGMTNEWDRSGLEFDAAAHISYTFTNDFKYLYILLTTSDSSTKLSILKSGLTVLVSPHARKKAMASIHFPAGTGLQESSAGQQSYQLEGFSTGNGSYSAAQDNQAGIRLHVAQAGHHEWVYEAIIPFTAVFADEKFEVDGRKFSAGFSFNSIPPSGGHKEVKIWRTFVLSPK